MQNISYVIPMPPTPDAELHLGHIAGPYLSADIFYRLMKARGAECKFLTGIDAYENWCAQQGADKIQQMKELHNKAFERLAIKFDDFSSPFDINFKDTYVNCLKDTYKSLQESSNFKYLEEDVLYDSETQTFGFGVEICGYCPHCQENVSGNSCITCFNYLQPHQLKTPHMPRCAQAKKKSVENGFFSLHDMEASFLQSLQIPDFAIDRYRTWLKETDGLMRLTYQSDFGVPVVEGGARIIRNTYLQYCVALIAKSLKTYTRKKKISVFSFMGMDNFIPSVIGSVKLSQSFSNLEFKEFHLNHMLNYNGRKFSKSKNYGPTVMAFSRNMNNNERSNLRVFLSSIDLTTSIGEFNGQKFEKFSERYQKIKDFTRKLPVAENITALREANAGHMREILQGEERRFNRASFVESYLERGGNLISSYSDENMSAFIGMMGVIDPIFKKELEDCYKRKNLKA